ncbi:ABC transporter permease [Deinococcus sp. SL84]|uniref:ABC transporter permease n=1 Tax=Deinococcus sp. SL84 TaxID=2994663 RepID=UPI002273ADE8|nr:ABC transporter permease [Deinococcus sp. SL84]MCY1703866.1 ABC transporter permease [Deinococcus sp. SL84]
MIATTAFTARNRKEILRDPVSIILGIGMPISLLVMFSMIGKQVPNPSFRIENFAPGMIVFAFTFVTMFIATLIANDRQNALLLRLFASPLTATQYVWGYASSLFSLALLQGMAGFVVAALLGLPLSINILVAIAVLIPTIFMSIFLGLVFGSLLGVRQLQGLSGLYITVAALLSGAWMPVEIMGSVLKTVAELLPFTHAVTAARFALAGDWQTLLPHFLWTMGYALLAGFLAVWAFQKLTRRNA